MERWVLRRWGFVLQPVGVLNADGRQTQKSPQDLRRAGFQDFYGWLWNHL